jgi:hypothetical protein
LIAFSHSRDKREITLRNGIDVTAGKNFRYLVEIQHVLYPVNDFIMSKKIKTNLEMLPVGAHYHARASRGSA